MSIVKGSSLFVHYLISCKVFIRPFFVTIEEGRRKGIDSCQRSKQKELEAHYNVALSALMPIVIIYISLEE